MKLGKRLKLRKRNRNSRRREAGLSIHRTERDTMRDAKGKPKQIIQDELMKARK